MNFFTDSSLPAAPPHDDDGVFSRPRRIDTSSMQAAAAVHSMTETQSCDTRASWSANDNWNENKLDLTTTMTANLCLMPATFSVSEISLLFFYFIVPANMWLGNERFHWLTKYLLLSRKKIMYLLITECSRRRWPYWS
jgi:hypothetical protein